MLHSTFYHKQTKEDPKTSAVFENLTLLPGNVFWHLLRQSCNNNNDMPTISGELLSFEFWPHWDPSNTENSNYVEPDLYLEFQLFDVIVEAKYREKKGQSTSQWEREIQSYHNEKNDKKKLILIAVGGNAVLKSKPKNGTSIYNCTWLSILISVNKYKKELDNITIPDYYYQATKRIIDNIILAFNINGVYNIEWFNTMSQNRLTISTKTAENIKKFYNWQ